MPTGYADFDRAQQMYDAQEPTEQPEGEFECAICGEFVESEGVVCSNPKCIKEVKAEIRAEEEWDNRD